MRTQPWNVEYQWSRAQDVPPLRLVRSQRTDGDRLDDAESNLVDFAVNLLSQQIWCWGRDIQRTEGNWLVEIGFSRIAPPTDREDCSSIYVLNLPRAKQVLLRGFGVFYGERRQGSVFLPRFQFHPQFTPNDVLDSRPWSDVDTAEMTVPAESHRSRAVSLTLELIDWIRTYEADVADRLGIDYRRKTLIEWDNGKRSVIAAENMASSWRQLSLLFANHPDTFLETVRI